MRRLANRVDRQSSPSSPHQRTLEPLVDDSRSLDVTHNLRNSSEPFAVPSRSQLLFPRRRPSTIKTTVMWKHLTTIQSWLSVGYTTSSISGNRLAGDLPVECIQRILHFVPLTRVFVLMSVSRRWHVAAECELTSCSYMFVHCFRFWIPDEPQTT